MKNLKRGFKRKLAKETGVSPQLISMIFKRKKFARLPLAVKIEKLTNGEIKVEDLVRDDVREALEEYLKLRKCK